MIYSLELPLVKNFSLQNQWIWMNRVIRLILGFLSTLRLPNVHLNHLDYSISSLMMVQQILQPKLLRQEPNMPLN